METEAARMMGKYRKKPIVIEAVQWTGKMANVISLVGHDLPTAGRPYPDGSLLIETLEGKMVVQKGDWIIKGVNGEFYPCKPDIFEKTYERVDAS